MNLSVIKTRGSCCAISLISVANIVLIVTSGRADCPTAASTWAADGRWEAAPPNEPCESDPDMCWPEAAVHMIHVPYRDPTTQKLVSRILVWYNPPVAPPQDGDTECPPPSTSLDPRLWDPISGDQPTYPSDPPTNDCNAVVGIADGKILVAGGSQTEHVQSIEGRKTLLFDPAAIDSGSGPWSQSGDMNYARWYPTATTLGDSRVVIMAGIGMLVEGSPDCDPDLCDLEECEPAEPPCCQCPAPDELRTAEVYDPADGTWTVLADSLPSGLTINIYPFNFLLPSGELFVAGPPMLYDSATSGYWDSWILDIDDETWSRLGSYPHTLYGLHGSAAMFRPGMILKCGGYHPDDVTYNCATFGDTAIIKFIDDSGEAVSSPDWVTTSGMSMANARKDHNLICLPDGKILSVGGSTACGGAACKECDDPVLTAEWIDPNAGTPAWIELADQRRPRGYHATATLLQDGRILSVGGEMGDYVGSYDSSRSAEIFSPPYLFYGSSGSEAPRPVIEDAPEEIHYGETFTVYMPSSDPKPIKMVSLVRLGMATHGFDQNQRFVPLEFMQDDEELTVYAPRHGNFAAPPGYYMLFLVTDHEATDPVTDHDVPSIASYVRLDGTCAGDLDGDGDVDGTDLGILLGDWGNPGCLDVVCCPSDFTDSNGGNPDGIVNGYDMAILLGGWTGSEDYPRDCESQESFAMGGGYDEPSSSAFDAVLDELGLESYEDFLTLLQMAGAEATAALVEQAFSP